MDDTSYCMIHGHSWGDIRDDKFHYCSRCGCRELIDEEEEDDAHIRERSRRIQTQVRFTGFEKEQTPHNEVGQHGRRK